MRLGFINIGHKLAQFFIGSVGHLPADWEVGFYFEGKPKVRSLVTKSGFRAYPGRRRVNCRHLPRLHLPVVEHVGRKALRLGVDLKEVTARIERTLPGMMVFLEDFRPDVVFVWNGSDLVATLAEHLCNDRGIPVIYGENGYLPFTMQVDREGVNFDSSITHRLPPDLAQPIPTEAGRLEAINFLRRFRNGDFPHYTNRIGGARPSVWSRLEDAIVNRKPIRRRSRFNRNIPSSIELPQRYAFLPLQVIQDSQLLFHSPLIGQDLPRLIRETASALKDVAPDHRLVVKLHPQDLQRTDYDAMARRLNSVLFVRDMDIREIIAAADVVITVNSTVGLEAVLLEKPVVTVGHNFYTIPELVTPLIRLEDMSAALGHALRISPDRERILRLVHLSRQHYFAGGSYRDHSVRSYRAVAEKIVTEATMAGPRHSDIESLVNGWQGRT